MTDTEKLVNAIAAHAKWRFNLKQAIETGSSEFNVETVKSDADCEFGQWLRSLPLAERVTMNWRTVRDLHAQFHEAAAAVLDMALSGRTDEANEELARKGRFSQISTQLTLAMSTWRKESEAKI
jgi:hypothetical protein